MTFDILIQGGTVLDGAASEGQLADVGISGKAIKAIGDLKNAKAGTVISAEGKYVSPGFIDIQNHSDSYLTLLEIPTQESLVAQGITTIAVGHCGTSLAPLSSPEALKSVQKWHSLAGANLNWLTFAEYIGALQNYPLGVNVLSLVGHSTLRRGLLRDQVRQTTPEEVDIMLRLLRESFDSGAAGLSFGLVYAHEADAAATELQALFKETAKKRKLVSAHLRSESGHVSDALEEVLSLAQDAGARLKISHFKIRGRQNWGQLEEALANLDRGYQRGVDVFFDVYPYTTSWTVLYTYLPKWAYEGGRSAILKNLKDPGARAKILAYLKGLEQDLGSVFVAMSEANQIFTGKTLAQIAANQEISVQEALLNVIEATQAQVVVFDHDISEENLNILLKHPLSIVATDGAGYNLGYISSGGLVHPRCFGTMPKFLAMVRDNKLMPWGEAVKKLSANPAAKLGLSKRGLLQEGYFADVAVWDPHTVRSTASYENPYQAPDGIDYVLVNGKIAFSANISERSLSGRVLQL